MKRQSLAVAALFGATMLAGCATTTPVDDRTLDNDPAMKTIQEAVRHIEKQNAMLVQIEQGKDPIPAPAAKPEGIEEFDRLVYLRNWNGPAMKAINQVAATMGYRTTISGSVPAIEPTVSLDVNGEPAYDVLRDISDQGQRQFDLRIDIDRKLINVAFSAKRS